ncbi:DUF5085 family protein [Paenibacillus sp. M.A.Huq-81]
MNILSLEVQCLTTEWPLYARELRNSVLKNNLYPTGPFMFQASIDGETSIYTFHVPINEEVDVEGLNGFSFHPNLVYEDGLLFRHSDSEESLEESYELLRMAATENGVILEEPFFNIHIPAYGEPVIDIYAPIRKEESGLDY